jgi:heme A synthase
MTAQEVRSSRNNLARGLVLLLIVLALGLMTAPRAGATAEGTEPAQQEPLTFEELRQSSSQRAQEFFPEEYEEPSWFQWLSIPVLLVGLVIALALLGAYLWWQPRFAAERRQKQRR